MLVLFELKSEPQGDVGVDGDDDVAVVVVVDGLVIAFVDAIDEVVGVGAVDLRLNSLDVRMSNFFGFDSVCFESCCVFLLPNRL
jgi:hypothetical protein